MTEVTQQITLLPQSTQGSDVEHLTQDLVVGSIIGWFKLAVPTPTPDNYRVQLGCHLEEVGEMLEKVFDPHDPLTIEVNEEADYLKSGKSRPIHLSDMTDSDKADLLDSLCDQIVTAIGVAHMAGFNIYGALHHVNAANWGKFVNGVPQFSPQGKIMKPEGWEPANLVPFISKQD